MGATPVFVSPRGRYRQTESRGKRGGVGEQQGRYRSNSGPLAQQAWVQVVQVWGNASKGANTVHAALRRGYRGAARGSSFVAA